MRALAVRVTDTETGQEADFRFVHATVRIGRAEECELRLASGAISRRHGSLAFDGAKVTYADLGSTNGSLLNGVPCKPNVAVELEDGATICVGQILLKVTVADAVAASAKATFPDRPISTESENLDAKTVVLLSGSSPLARPAPLSRSKLAPISLGDADSRGEHPTSIPEAALSTLPSPNPAPECLPASLEPRRMDVLAGLERIAAQERGNADRELLLAARTALESLARDLAVVRSSEDRRVTWRELLHDAVSTRATRSATSPVAIPGPREIPIADVPLNQWPETRLLDHRQQQGPRLVALGDDAGVPFFLLDKAELTIGRDEDCDIIIAHSSVSRNHARIVSNAGRWTLIDLDSANGVFVDGARFRSAEIKHGSLVQIGRVRFQASFTVE
jgi:pSer/pThr/pTyr-binding forkhead associated (FHA) protein